MNILLIGEESAGVQTLKLLTSGPHNLVGCLASPEKKAGGGMTLWQTAEKLGVPRWPAELVKDASFADVVKSENVDLILNVHSLFIIKDEIICAPRYGSYNLHPGPLPTYAGLNAPSWAIYHGEQQHGVTLHKMAAGIDTGTITYQSIFNIEDKDTGFTLSAKCIRHGMELIKQLLEISAIDPASIPSIEQDFSKRSYFGKKTPQDGWLDWSKSAREIFNFVRAADYSPFQSPWIHPRALQMGQLDREISFIKLTPTDVISDAEPGTVDISDVVRVASSDLWVEINKLSIDQKAADPKNIFKSGDQLKWIIA